MKLLKRTILTMLILLLLTAPALSLAESDYETGDGWIYQDGTLTITENNGLGDFINNEDPITQLPKYKHTVYDVTRVVIGRNVADLAIDSMVGPFEPSEVVIEEGNECFIDDNGWIVNKKTNTLFGAANIKESIKATAIDNLPSYIEVIGPHAVAERRNLTRINIPSSAKEVQESAFWLCKSLKTVKLPDELHTLGDFAFASCDSLTTIELPTNLSNIGNGVFSGCIKLNSPNIKDTLITRISNDCFGACFSIQMLELPESTQRIETLAFRICYDLNTLIINSSDLVIEEKAFADCDKLNRIIFTKGTPKSFADNLFDETEKTPDGKSYISSSYERRGEIIPYPTLYYTAAYADEWAPNGETEWNGYTIQQISQEELDLILAEARGEALPAAVSSPAPAAVQQVETPAPEKANAEAAPKTGTEGILLAAIGLAAAAVAALLVIRLRKTKQSEKR
ncbi:MAG TPA: leucine-rich repeat domain-containing protein [Clostridia bacterium]|nr:leucine-rich repeat domain-containing protein [Clostridia bacterium]